MAERELLCSWLQKFCFMNILMLAQKYMNEPKTFRGLFNCSINFILLQTHAIKHPKKHLLQH